MVDLYSICVALASRTEISVTAGKKGKTAIRGAITVQRVYECGQVGFICNYVSTQRSPDVFSGVCLAAAVPSKCELARKRREKYVPPATGYGFSPRGPVNFVICWLLRSFQRTQTRVYTNIQNI